MPSGSKGGAKRKAAILCSAAAALLSGCASSLDEKLSDNSPSLERAAFSAELSPVAERIAQSFLGQEAVFDSAAIEAAFAAIAFPSPKSVSVGNEGERLRLDFLGINLDEGIFLELNDGGTRAFSLDAGKGSLVITLTKEIVAKTTAALPAELFEYADLLMAPVLTGERMTEEEYIGLIAAAYGPQAAAELRTCAFELAVQCPAAVTRASAREPASLSLGAAYGPASGVRATSSGAQARFLIPAAKVFALSSPLQLVVEFGSKS